MENYLPPMKIGDVMRGVGVYFDNVGGTILDAVLEHIDLRARIVVCGLISQYNATERVPGPYNFAQILMKRARIEGSDMRKLVVKI
jgi:NADPH-dependent curcumin reductase CurA